MFDDVQIHADLEYRVIAWAGRKLVWSKAPRAGSGEVMCKVG
jgi:hypothetical protein